MTAYPPGASGEALRCCTTRGGRVPGADVFINCRGRFGVGESEKTNMASNLVLVTGSAGRIGRAVVAELLARGQAVRGFDVVPTPGLRDSVVGDITDPSAVHRAVQGAAAVVHLAATPDDDDFLTKLVPNNIVGVYHVLESARAAGVRRLVLASSGQVVWWQRFRGPVPGTAGVPPTPRG